MQKSLAVNLHFNFFQWLFLRVNGLCHESAIHNLFGILRLFPQATIDPPEVPESKIILVYF